MLETSVSTHTWSDLNLMIKQMILLAKFLVETQAIFLLYRCSVGLFWQTEVPLSACLTCACIDKQERKPTSAIVFKQAQKNAYSTKAIYGKHLATLEQMVS